MIYHVVAMAQDRVIGKDGVARPFDCRAKREYSLTAGHFH